MIAVITGDVINSRSTDPVNWITRIKQILRRNKIPKRQWEIYRGDMFQIELPAIDSLRFAIELKAAVKEIKNIDLRMSIGFGTKNYSSNTVMESNGEAYIASGQKFENLKKITIGIKSPWNKFNARWDIIVRLGLLTMDNWAPITSEIFKTALQNPLKSQKELAKKLDKKQSSISEGLSRAGYSEIIKMIRLFEEELDEKISKV